MVASWGLELMLDVETETIASSPVITCNMRKKNSVPERRFKSKTASDIKSEKEREEESDSKKLMSGSE